MKLFGKKIPLSVSLLIWALVWELVGRFGFSSIFPPLSQVIVVGVDGRILDLVWIQSEYHGAMVNEDCKDSQHSQPVQVISTPEISGFRDHLIPSIRNYHL